MTDEDGRDIREGAPEGEDARVEARKDASPAPVPPSEEDGWPSETDEEDEGVAVPAGAEGPVGRKKDEGPAYRKADILNRSIARFIDVLFCLLLARLPGYVGFFAGLTYAGIADGLFAGQSIGKRIIGLRVLYSGDGRPADFRASILRNSPIGLLYMVFHIPIVGFVLAGLGLGFETLLIIGSPEGRRLGDEIAATVVVDEAKS